MRGGLLALTIVIVLSPWMIRNLVVLGEPVWTTTHGGYTLALANNPVYYRRGPATGRRAASGPARTSGAGGIRSTARRTACPNPRPIATCGQGLATWLEIARRFRPCDAGPARAFLERGPGCLGLLRRRAMGDHGLDDPPLGSRSVLGLLQPRTSGAGRESPRP